MNTEQLEVLKAIISTAVLGSIWRADLGSAPLLSFEELREISDAAQMLDRCSMRSLHTDKISLRDWIEARMSLLARAIASSTEEGLVSGYVVTGELRLSFLANTSLQEFVIEDNELRFIVVKPKNL